MAGSLGAACRAALSQGRVSHCWGPSSLSLLSLVQHKGLTGHLLCKALSLRSAGRNGGDRDGCGWWPIILCPRRAILALHPCLSPPPPHAHTHLPATSPLQPPCRLHLPAGALDHGQRVGGQCLACSMAPGGCRSPRSLQPEPPGLAVLLYSSPLPHLCPLPRPWHLASGLWPLHPPPVCGSQGGPQLALHCQASPPQPGCCPRTHCHPRAPDVVTPAWHPTLGIHCGCPSSPSS